MYSILNNGISSDQKKDIDYPSLQRIFNHSIIYELQPADNPILWDGIVHICNELSVAIPIIYVIEHPIPRINTINVTGSIAITSSFMALPYAEIRHHLAAIAHEIGHSFCEPEEKLSKEYLDIALLYGECALLYRDTIQTMMQLEKYAAAPLFFALVEKKLTHMIAFYEADEKMQEHGREAAKVKRRIEMKADRVAAQAVDPRDLAEILHIMCPNWLHEDQLSKKNPYAPHPTLKERFCQLAGLALEKSSTQNPAKPQNRRMQNSG